MALIEWRDEFSTGIDAVDFEHKGMIELINEAHAHLEAGAPREQIDAFLGEIYARISGHFALEESVMKARHYDEFADHKQDHERLLDAIRDIMDDYDAGDFDGMSAELGRRLQDWFVEHFKARDARLHRLLGVS